MKLLNFQAVCFTGLFLCLAPVSARAFTLDAFSSVNSGSGRQTVFENVFDDFTEEFRDKPSDSDINLDNSVIGNNRHLKITIDPPENTNNEAILRVDTTESKLSLSTEANIVSTGLVVWNGSNSVNYDNLSQNASLNVNLEENGDDSIAVNIQFSDLGGTLSLELYDGVDTYSLSRTIPIVQIGSPVQPLYYDFQTYNDNLVDTQNIQYISMSITGSAASDTDLDFLQTTVQPQAIPFKFSPGLGLILCGSIFGFLKLRKKISIK